MAKTQRPAATAEAEATEKSRLTCSGGGGRQGAGSIGGERDQTKKEDERCTKIQGERDRAIGDLGTRGEKGREREEWRERGMEGWEEWKGTL